MRSLAAAVLVALVVAPGAAAKGIERAVVCGPSRCVSLERPPQALLDWGGGAPGRTPAPRPFYRVTFHFTRDDPGSVAWFVPGDRSTAFAGTRGDGRLRTLGRSARAAFARVTRGLRPYPTPRITGALVGGRPAADPGSYLSLIGRPGELDEIPLAGDWLTVELRSDVESPWTGRVALLVSPSKRVLQDGFRFSRLDRETVERIVQRRSLAR